MTIIHKVPMLRITKCSDVMRWYRDMIGQLVPLLSWSELDGYKSRDAQGYINFVLTEDAQPASVHVATNELAHWPFSHYVYLDSTMRKNIFLAEHQSTAWPHIVKNIGKAKRSGSHGEPDVAASKSQTRYQSLVETVTNIGIGWLLSLGVTAVVLPYFGHQVTFGQNAAMTTIFTVVSLVRSYAVRRFFNNLHSQKL